MMLLRSLVPSWKFFEDIGDMPILFYKIQDNQDNWSDWQSFHQNIRRRAWHLFFNPQLNLQLAEKSALQHAVQDLTEENRDNPVSLEIIENMVRTRLSKDTQNFQFKISVSDGIEIEEIYYSEVLK